MTTDDATDVFPAFDPEDDTQLTDVPATIGQPDWHAQPWGTHDRLQAAGRPIVVMASAMQWRNSRAATAMGKQ